MSPRRIAREAARRGIGLVALTDHNTARNVGSFDRCCRQEGIKAVFGLEVTSREEGHILCLFETVETAEEMGALMEASLPDLPGLSDRSDILKLKTRRSSCDDQVYVDEDEQILGLIPKILIAATEYSTEELVSMTHRRGGLVIPSHVDRHAFSIVTQLGFLPPLSFDAVECVSLCGEIETHGIPVITNSDAHYPEAIGRRPSTFDMAELSFEGLRRALLKRKNC